MQEGASNAQKAKASKRLEKLTRQLAETRSYDEALGYVASQRIDLDLDDGVVVNYAKFQGIPVSTEGKRERTIDLLAKI